MATVRKRGKRWQAIVRKAGQPPQSQTFGTKAEAIAWGVHVEAGMEKGGKVRKTLADAMDRYAEDVAPGKRGSRWELIRIEKLKRELPFAETLIGDVTPDDISDWARKSKLAAGSIRREASLLSSIFTYARRTLRWLTISPMTDAVLPKPPKARKQGVTDQQADAIIAACGYQRGEKAETALHRVAVAFLYALQTAMRAGEICGIEPGHIHKQHVHLPETKNGEARDVPQSKEALALLACLPKTKGPVFDLTPGVLDVLYRKARAAAAKRDKSVAAIHFHDTRREALTRMVAGGKISPMELARISGHKDLKILLNVYYSPDVNDLADKLG